MSERSTARLRRLAAGVPLPDSLSARSARFDDHWFLFSRSTTLLPSATAPAPAAAAAAARQLERHPSGPHHTVAVVRPSTSPNPARYSPSWSAPISEPLLPE